MPSMLGGHPKEGDVEHIAETTQTRLDQCGNHEENQDILLGAAHYL